MKCTCQNVLATFGQPGCKRFFGSAKGIILSYDEQAKKFVTPSPTIPFDLFVFNLAHRYLIKTLRNTSVEVSDPIFQEFDDGYREFIRGGAITFTATIPRSTFQYICNLEQLLCYNPVLAYLIDKDGNLLAGAKRIDQGGNITYDPLKLTTVVTQPAFASDTTVQAATITFRLETPVCDLHVVSLPMNLLEVDPFIPLELIYLGLNPTNFYLRPDFDGVFGEFASFSGFPTISWLTVEVDGNNVTSTTTLNTPAYNANIDAVGFTLQTPPIQSLKVVAGTALINAGYYIDKTILL